MEIKNDIFLRAIHGQEVERPPIWLMRQAGRILPEYRAVRASVENFVALVKNPALCAEVTIQPVDALDVDAAILFSDILGHLLHVGRGCPECQSSSKNR